MRPRGLPSETTRHNNRAATPVGAESLASPRIRPAGVRWLDGPLVDLPFYIGASLVGWAALLAHVLGGVPAIALYFVWILFLDGPHLWATISRTYFDREEWRTRRPVLLGALAWALLPLSVLGWGLATGQRLPWALFLVFAQLWAYWHVVRQHYGFLGLYQRKAGEPAGPSNRIDYLAFYTVMLAPFVSFALRHPMARHELGLPATLSTVERGLNLLLILATAAAIALYAGKEVWRWRQRALVNVGKNLFLAGCVPLHLTVLLHPTWSVSIELLALSVIVTSYHNVQYDAIVWSYGRRRYRGAGTEERHGLASRLFRSVIPWYLAGVAITIALRYASWSLDGRFWPFAPSGRTLAGPFTATEYVNAWWWFVAIHHYYVDQRIWRVSRDTQVRSALGLSSAPAGDPLASP
jgi:hypothetical protein